MTDQPIIELSGVEKAFGSFKAVTDLDLSLKQGEFFSLLGPSGCGKTTALRMIAGFQEPTAGTVRIDGQDMADIPANKRPTNMVFQSYAIFPHLNVGDNVGFGLVKQGLSRADRKARIAEALELVELGGLQGRKADELSGGQRQRVALARALVMRPKVLLLDEPLSALDKNLREAMQLELRRLQQSIGITFVMVTHDQYEAMTMSDRIGVMFNGRLEQVDAPAILYARPANREVAAFIGGMNFLPAQSADQSGNEISADVPGFGKLSIQRNPNVTARGRDLMLGIRPEQLEIAREVPEGYDATLKAEVENVAFYGESVHYHVRAPGVERTLAVAVPNHFHTVDFARGDAVFIGVQNASVIDLGSDTNPERN
ncbi:ABC transporter ATP-binding protein [Roseovarius indicus]|uniref:Spermidine/putrescine ABC transporter ATPase n=1 Tax=Roseovarius indicus TaxID=540747 RepID=A0A0T5P241_9RHOB|nr:ABC transporter ATP-binding protein [Roseovarius indicus]KRS15226.1 spermidine/putrescine ABC transporter ATPase [Roseovarius indicus]QEW24876.1 Spermidine/putrescine import ATP-binding protein PotA [Roseovarius indicus]SFE49594.1 spermidine/putrescine transport system ATP-binding protein [Roseovarius indicus]